MLLTAYADTNAAIEAINVVGLDHYLMKPWDPPEDRLYPVLDDLLEDWAADRRPTFEGIRVVGTRWSPDSHDVKDFLSRNQIPYLFLDVDHDSEARRLLDTVADPMLPVIFFPDAEPMIHPDRRALAERVGLHTEATAPLLRRHRHRRRPGRPGGVGVRSLGGLASCHDRAPGHRRPGRNELSDRELPRLPQGHQRR